MCSAMFYPQNKMMMISGRHCISTNKRTDEYCTYTFSKVAFSL